MYPYFKLLKAITLNIKSYLLFSKHIRLRDSRTLYSDERPCSYIWSFVIQVPLLALVFGELPEFHLVAHGLLSQVGRLVGFGQIGAGLDLDAIRPPGDCPGPAFCALQFVEVHTGAIAQLHFAIRASKVSVFVLSELCPVVNAGEAVTSRRDASTNLHQKF